MTQRGCAFHRNQVQDRSLGRGRLGGHEALIACRYRYRILQPRAQADTLGPPEVFDVSGLARRGEIEGWRRANLISQRENAVGVLFGVCEVYISRTLVQQSRFDVGRGGWKVRSGWLSLSSERRLNDCLTKRCTAHWMILILDLGSSRQT